MTERKSFRIAMAFVGLTLATAAAADLPDGPVTDAQLARGRQAVLEHACADCHSHGHIDPRDPWWLSGYRPGDGLYATAGQIAYPANLTPDPDTGVGSFTPRQLFNALRYGLDPGATPDGEITATVPGVGGFPAWPVYLSRSMPWTSFRHLPDGTLWDLIAYLQHGVVPVVNAVPANPQPPRPANYAPALVGEPALPPFPAGNERGGP